MGQRIRKALQPPFEVEGERLTISASIGAAHSEMGAGTPQDLLRLADAAMYRAKKAGSTDVHLFDPDRDDQFTGRLEKKSAFENALEEDEFVVHYQPIYHLESGEIAGAEALVRWEHPERGLLLPGEFIPFSEETDLIVPLGRRVLEKVFRHYARWRDRSLVGEGDFWVSVNVSARQLVEGDLNGTILRESRVSGVPLSSLLLEVTETIAMSGPDTFAPLQERGLKVAIDDFGTDYSSLSYLRHFTTDVLKLDRSFIANLGSDDATADLVQGLVELARRIDVAVVAEGIEETEELGRLKEFGCTYGQGYLLGEPLPAGTFAEVLGGRPDDSRAPPPF